MKNKNGFTLFELLVSISIIAIMTALASVAFSGAQKKARDSKRMQDIKLIQTAAEQYYSQSGYLYPSTTAPGDWIAANGQAILSAFPFDPKPSNQGYDYNHLQCGDNSCFCVCADTEEDSKNANSNNSCQFNIPSANKTSFCAVNQQ